MRGEQTVTTSVREKLVRLWLPSISLNRWGLETSALRCRYPESPTEKHGDRMPASPFWVLRDEPSSTLFHWKFLSLALASGPLCLLSYSSNSWGPWLIASSLTQVSPSLSNPIPC